MSSTNPNVTEAAPCLLTHVRRELERTEHLSAEEFGAYRRLQLQYWAKGDLPSDDDALRLTAGCPEDRWEAIRVAVLPLLSWRLHPVGAA